MHSLPVFVRLQGRAVILLGDGDAAGAKRVLLERAGAEILGEEANATLAIVAIDDDAAALAAIVRLKSRGILVNAVDRPEHCDFTLPAIVDRSPVLIAIGTGGASAGLAKALRIRLEAILPARLGHLADGLLKARAAIRNRWPGARDRRIAIDDALAPGGALDPLADRTADDVAAWLASPDQARAQGIHHIKITSTDPDDLTLKEARLLGQADVIHYHPNISPAILARGRADATRIASIDLPTDMTDGLIIFLEQI